LENEKEDLAGDDLSGCSTEGTNQKPNGGGGVNFKREGRKEIMEKKKGRGGKTHRKRF